MQELSTSMAELELHNTENETRYEKLEAQSCRENLKLFDIEVRRRNLGPVGVENTPIYFQ